MRSRGKPCQCVPRFGIGEGPGLVSMWRHCKLRLGLPRLQLRAKDVEVGLLRASPSRLALIRSWDVDLNRLGVSFKVNGSAGITYQGELKLAGATVLTTTC